jgi:two-component system LytT family response regulator
MTMRAFVLDDEPLAVRRLSRMLAETGRVEIAGTGSDPVDAVEWLSANKVDVLFLDIQMPGMDGFEALSMLNPQPLVVFTTAYDKYALQAFEVNSIDYLLKPIEERHLVRALDKIERLRAGGIPQDLASQLASLLQSRQPAYPERIASRLGERLQFLDLDQVSHFFAKDKLTYAATRTKNYVVGHTISDLEQKLNPKQFCRIHRSTLLNLAYVLELDAWFEGGVLARLKDEKRTELQVSRDRVQELKKRLGV